MPRIIHNDYLPSTDDATIIMFIRDDRELAVKLAIDKKYLEVIQAHKWIYNVTTQQVSTTQPRLTIATSTRVLLQHFICKLEYPGKIFKHIAMDHPHDFRVAKMRPKFHNKGELDAEIAL